MNVSCPQCKTVFRVDPRKVPQEGVRARCSVCGGVFEVVGDGAGAGAAARSPDRSSDVAAETGSGPRRAAPSEPASGAPSPQAPGPQVGGGQEQRPQQRPQQRPAQSSPAGERRPAQQAGSDAGSEAARPAGPAQGGEQASAPDAPRPTRPSRPFGRPDPDARARRLARALISDLAAYHPEKQEVGLREGRLKELFQEELKKSWQEYVDQVGLDLAKKTPYFRDALNEILAKGKRVF